MKKLVVRYQSGLVVLHWISAVLIIGMLLMGFLVLAWIPADASKIGVLRLHMIIGMTILALTVVRFLFRLLTAHPAPSSSGFEGLDRLAPLVHYTMYGLVILMAVTGIATAKLSGLTDIVFGDSRAPLPADLGIYPTFKVHFVLAVSFAVLIFLHILAALYHHFVRHDGLIYRMLLGGVRQPIESGRKAAANGQWSA